MVAKARVSQDELTAKKHFGDALELYRRAAVAWAGSLLGGPADASAYDSNFWLADAHTNVVLISVALGQIPSPTTVLAAKQAAARVRDSKLDDKFLVAAAMMVVRVAEQVVQAHHQAHRRSGGSEGFALRNKLETNSFVATNGEERTRVVKHPFPKPVKELLAAYDEYVARVPLSAALAPYRANHRAFAYRGGEIAFFYGHLSDAKIRFEPLKTKPCNKATHSYPAWVKLVTMANIEGNVTRSLELSKWAKSSCPSPHGASPGSHNPYPDAYRAFRTANKMSDGPERREAWLKAARLYERALRAAPGHSAAPEAAINGAFAHKMAGHYQAAIDMFELFTSQYGEPSLLQKLITKGKSSARHKRLYDQRVGYLALAHQKLAEAYVLFFDFQRAARQYAAIGASSHFKSALRREALRNAIVLGVALGAASQVAKSRRRLIALKPTDSERAEIDWLIVDDTMKRWDERLADGGVNRRARLQALGAMQRFYRAWSNKPAGSKYVVRSAHALFRMYRAAASGTKRQQSEGWCDKTIRAFSKHKANRPSDRTGQNEALGSLEADMAAECAYRVIDKKLERRFDYDTGHQRFAGRTGRIEKNYNRCVDDATRDWFQRLHQVITGYRSRKWSIVARARQGSLFDSCRQGLSLAEPKPKLSPREQTRWRNKTELLLVKADRAMVAGYVQAIAWAREQRLNLVAVAGAIKRLSALTDLLGDDKLRLYVTAVQDRRFQPLSYEDGMFQRMHPGLTLPVEARFSTAPLPAQVE